VARAFGDKLTQTQINDVTASVIALSRATGTDGARSASIMASTLAQFGLGAEQASRVADVLTFTANATLNSVDSLGEALKYAGTNAALAGMDIEQTAAILGTLGNLGVQGSDAGTVLKRLLIITGAEAAKLKAIFGVSFLDMNGNVRPLVDTLNDVAAATAGMASGEKLAKFNEAFGLLGISAAVGVGRAGDATRKLEADIRNAAGTAVRQAEFMNSGVGGAMRNLTTAVGNLGNAFASALVPAIGDASSGLLGALGAITRFVSANQETARQLALVAAGLVASGAAAIAMGTAITGLAIAVGLAQKVLAFPGFLAANPAIMAGLAAVTVAVGFLAIGAKLAGGDISQLGKEFAQTMRTMENTRLPTIGEGGRVTDRQIREQIVSTGGQASLRDIQRRAVSGESASPTSELLALAMNERQYVQDHQRMSDDEKKRRTFALNQIISHLNGQIQAEAKTAEAAKEVAAVSKERSESVRQLTDEQQKEIDQIRQDAMTPQQKLEAEKARLMSLTSDAGNGLSQAELDAAIKRAEEQAQQEIDAANKKANEERDRLTEQAQAVREQVATPDETLAARIEELKKLPLDAETMARAVDQAKADAVDSLTSAAQADRQGISSAGTFGDATMLGVGPELSDPMAETAANTRRMVDELAAMNMANGGPANVVGPPVANLAGPIGAEVAAPRAADLQQRIDGGAEAATATATLTASVQTMQQQMVAAIDRTTAAVQSTVAVLKEIAGNTAEMGGVFV
jgi:TP901 family phage tail tape measure protein